MATNGGQVRIAIVADDLTGAGDSAVQFVGPSVDVRIVLSDDAPRGAVRADTPADTAGAEARTVVRAYPADSRALAAEAAASATAHAVSRAVSDGAHSLFVKVDSTLRGSVAHQIDGALSEWRRTHPSSFAVVCPAYPRMGRTVEDAVVRVHGRPVAHTAAATDPVTAMSASDLGTLLPHSVHVRASGAGALADALVSAGRSGAVVTMDARTDAELAQVAAAIDALGGIAVPVGSAGLASAMAAVWLAVDSESVEGAPLPPHRSLSVAPIGPERADVTDAVPRILVVVSSLHAVSRTQAAALVRERGPADVAVREPTAEELRDRAAAARFVSGARNPRGARGDGAQGVTLLLSPAPVRGGAAVDVTARTRPSAETVADSLARVALGLVREQGIDTVVLVGGDGARAVLDASGARAMRVDGQPLEGVVLGEVIGGELSGLRVITKSGGFGDDRTLIDVLETL
ncbi:four-carbon acid sugar kinase family protein [Planctomonas psychrotolerans]|uniref:four-carbon acid sugar kinase family protein n=1 Tax=Planctomonas psychrotolerans TaxID=2528712 RepID=UPI0012387169|nr:four-carbon acid sugar kinase family protein [Planctomonas psychrotolerans]